MKDSDKTKEQLLEELRELRSQTGGRDDLKASLESTERALLESEERLRALSDASFEGIVIHDGGRIVLANRAFVDTLGYDEDEVVGMYALDFTADEFHDVVRKQISTGSEEAVVVAGRRKDGSTFPAEIRGKAVPFGGKTMRMVALQIIEDRQNARQAKLELRESERRFRTLFDNAPDAMFLANLESGKILDANAAAARLLQRKREAIVGMHQSDLHPPENRKFSVDTFHQHVAAGTERGHTDPVENQVQRADGSTVPVEVLANVVEIGGKPVIQGTFRDITERKRTERALRESETKYRTLFEQSSDAIYVATKDGRLLDVNQAGAALFGYARADMLQLNVADLYRDPGDAARVRMIIDRDGSVREQEAEGIRSDKSTINCLLTASVWHSEDGTVQGYQAVVRDVTEQRKAEAALRQSEQRFRTLVDHAPEAIVLWDAESGKFVDANANAEKLFGMTRDELLRVGPFEMSAPVQPDGRATPEVMENVAAVMSGQAPAFEWLHRNAAGEDILCEVRLVRLPGEPPLVRGSMTDIGERKRAEEALRESEERFRAVFESAAVGMVLGTREGELEQCNSAWERMVGYTADEIRALGFMKLTHPDDVVASKEALAALAKGGYPSVQLENRYIKEDGTVVWGLTSVSGVYDGEGELARTIAIVEDITERKVAETELESSRLRLRNLAARLHAIREEERAAMAREIHDELGQALTGLKMDLRWISDKLPEASGELQTRARSMLSLIDATVNSVRSLTSRLRPAILDDLGLEAAIDWQASDFSSKAGVPCELDLQIGDLSMGPERDTAVFRILQEALTNVARHANATNVQITLQQGANELLMVVHDNGRGVSLAEIVNPRSIGLTGMRERATVLGGHVEIRAAPGGGTEVTLRMPLAEQT